MREQESEVKESIRNLLKDMSVDQLRAEAVKQEAHPNRIDLIEAELKTRR